ncbi:MAG TPA: ABC transporter substrate-binding protein [Caldithrix abyssi]|uniref:ABC transporter substrate-binding protein n=1 Tax=Caldithrix abyssi TaxID=187145 RepID=A0A7V4U2W2_CALAY|nr:ABC transporter substrate-binding protein [Caldithrix abyssi]
MQQTFTWIFLLFFLSFSFAQKVTIKFATLALEGSTWMEVMNDFAKEVQDKTGGAVKFKIYSGGRQGDEKDVLRKIRINQLHSAGFTGVGLGAILPEVRVLEAPFLFKNHQEVDYINERFFDRFAKGFEKKGFILLGWAEVGFVYVFTNTEVKTIDDFKGVKMWMWEGDPLAEHTFRAFGLSPIPLSVTDVLTSLQTGLIDAVYVAPLACVGLQWFTRVKYMIKPHLTNAIGAVLVSKRIFKKLNAEQQKIVKEAGKEYFQKLTELSRKDNEKSIQVMRDQGIRVINISDAATLKSFDEIGAKTRRELVGVLYGKDILEEIETALREFRSKK